MSNDIEYKEIKGFENYIVYEDGTVVNRTTDKELTTDSVLLYNNGKAKWFTKSALMREYFTPTVDLEGFKTIPGFSNYMVNDKGVVYSKSRKIILNLTKSHRGYSVVSLYNDKGERKTKGVHHLVLMAFKPDDYKLITTDYRNNHNADGKIYTTNHIDGVKTNNRLDNLEVIEHKDNIKHAMDTGLMTVKPVKVKFHDTGEIKHYPSMNAASRALGMQESAVMQRLENPNYKWTLWSDGTQIILESDGEFENIRYIPKEGGGIQQNIVAIDYKKNAFEEIIYPSINEYCRVNGINPATVKKAFEHTEHPIMRNLHRIKKMDDPNNWGLPVKLDPIFELATSSYNKGRIYVFLKEGNVPIIKLPNEDFKIESDSRFSNTNIDKIREKLRYKDKYQLDDGYSVMYYEDFMTTEDYRKKWRGLFNQFEYLGV